MPICTNCGAQQPDGAAFCDECGTKLGEANPSPTLSAFANKPQFTPTAVVTTCHVCGTSTVPGEAYCDNCGAALGLASPAPPPQTAAPAPPPTVIAPTPAQTGAPACSNCGALLGSGSNFCDMCGTLVSTPAPAVVPAPPLAATIVSPAVSAPPPPVPAPAPVERYSPGAVIQGYLVVQSTNATISFPPGRTEITIGREDPVSNVFPEVDLTDHGGDEGGVSRQHARILLQGSQIFMQDLNSTNYTHVNQQRVSPGQSFPLGDGDEIRLGRVKLNFYCT